MLSLLLRCSLVLTHWTMENSELVSVFFPSSFSSLLVFVWATPHSAWRILLFWYFWRCWRLGVVPSIAWAWTQAPVCITCTQPSELFPASLGSAPGNGPKTKEPRRLRKQNRHKREKQGPRELHPHGLKALIVFYILYLLFKANLQGRRADVSRQRPIWC